MKEGQAVLVPRSQASMSGSRLGRIMTVSVRVTVRRADGTEGHFRPEELEPAHWCPEPDCAACISIASTIERLGEG